MTVLNWVGPETDIGQNCSMSGFTIQRLERKGTEIKANGTITTTDYGEHGWDFTDPWEASTADGQNWVVKHDDFGPKTSNVSVNDCAKTREFLFKTLSYGSMFLQQRLILAMILEFLKKGREALEIPEYKGKIEPIGEDCFCKEVHEQPGGAIWQKLTKGNFPRNCLLCPCDRGWHFGQDNTWKRTSREAFAVLAKYNGVITRYMRIDNGVLSLASEGECHYR